MAEILLSDEFARKFSGLQKKADAGNGNAIYLLKIIDRGIAKLSDDISSGQQVRRKLWPHCYTKGGDISNLWRLRLDDSWRMIYTVKGNRVRIVAIILEVLDHGDYELRFGYQ